MTSDKVRQVCSKAYFTIQATTTAMIYLSWVEKEGRERSGVEQWRYDNALQGVDTACMSYSSRLEKQELPTLPYLGNLTRRVYY